MIESRTFRRALACAAVFGCGAVIALSEAAFAQNGTQKPAATRPAVDSQAEAAQGADAERAALHRLALKYAALKDLAGARKAAAQKAYDAEKETFLKSFDPTYARDKAAYQAAADEYESRRRVIWQSALDELKAQGYEFNGTKLEGEDLQYRKRPVEEDLAESSAPRGEANEGYLAIVSKYVQSNAEIQDLSARRLQAYRALAAHQDALIEQIDAEIPAVSQEAAQPGPAKTAPLEAPKPAAEEPAKPLAEAPPKPAVEAPAKRGAMEPTQPLVEAPPKPPAETAAKSPPPETANPPAAAPAKPTAGQGAATRAEEHGPPPLPPELRIGEERPAGAVAAPPSETPLREKAVGPAGEKASREARAARGGLPPLPALPPLPKDGGLPPLPEAPMLPDEEEETAAIPAIVVAPPLVSAPEAAQARFGVFGGVNWAQPNLSWSGPWGAAVPFAVSRSLDRSFGGGGAQLALRLRPVAGLQGFAMGLALDLAGRAGSAQAGVAPWVSSGFSSRLQATQRVEVGYDVDLGGTTVVTPFATVGFSEAKFAVSNYSNVLGTFASGGASDFRLGATYGAGLELKVLGPATLQLLYLRHEYNPAAAAIWAGVAGGAFAGARKGLAENELRVGLVIPVPVPRPW